MKGKTNLFGKVLSTKQLNAIKGGTATDGPMPQTNGHVKK